jgi:hypothetical protein
MSKARSIGTHVVKECIDDKEIGPPCHGSLGLGEGYDEEQLDEESIHDQMTL